MLGVRDLQCPSLLQQEGESELDENETFVQKYIRMFIVYGQISPSIWKIVMIQVPKTVIFQGHFPSDPDRKETKVFINKLEISSLLLKKKQKFLLSWLDVRLYPLDGSRRRKILWANIN